MQELRSNRRTGECMQVAMLAIGALVHFLDYSSAGGGYNDDRANGLATGTEA